MANAPHFPFSEKAYQPGEIIHNRYRISNILGKGGVAITYRAVNLQTNSSVAIKVISLKRLNDWKQVELFQREAEVLAKLDHPAVPKYIDYFEIETETDKAFCIVQQQAPGKSLAQLVESGWRTSETEVKNIAQQILSILNYLHSLDPPVIHRDIKPNNLIRNDDEKIYLVDFGAVQNTYYNTLMQGSTVVGTYGYMAPEQFRGQALPATDLYSLGATLLYLLTHRSPAELPQDTLKLDFRNSVNISESFADWLEQILEPDIEDRFTSAEVALAQLFASKKVKQKKLITRLGIGVLAISAIAGFNSYKWWFLSRLGFYPDSMCYPKVSQNYIQQGGNLNLISTQGKFSILFCMLEQRSEKKEVFKKILLDIDNIPELINKPNDDNTTLLEEAVQHAYENSDHEIIKLLISLGANVNVNYQNPLFYAVIGNKENIVKLLIEHGADVNARDDSSFIPLIYAVTSRQENIVKFLVEHGADVNARDDSSFTALMHAVSGGQEDMVKDLIEHGAHLNAVNNSGLTALYYANDRDIILLLLKHGADVYAEDDFGRTPLFNDNDQDTVEILIEHGVDAKVKDSD